MAVNIDTVANKIFKIIKGSGHDVKMYDASTGNETVNPELSRYFYVKMPNYMVHVDADNSEIKLHQGAEKTDEKVKGVINNIKHIAKSYMLDFDHRIFGKELKPKNYAFKIDQNRNEIDMSELQTEGYTPLQGSTKTSEQKLEGVKVIVRHNKAVDENSRGARSRNIQGIFVETSEGERFKYPHIHLNGARAMARHVHAGGKPHDEVGEAIVNLSDQLAKLKEVTKFARRFEQVQEQAADILPLVNDKIAKIKNTVHKLTTATGYADFKENYKASETVQPTIEALEELKNKFTVTKFDEKIGEVLPLLQSIVDEAKAEQDNSSKALADRIMAKIKAGDPVDMHAPNATQQEYDPEKVGSFTNKDAKVAYRLSDLAAKIKDDEMSVFLARLSDKFTSYATDPNIQMKIKQDPETYQIQPWEKETAKAIIQGVKMKTVKPELDKLPKAEDVIPNPEKELEEMVAPYGEDESLIERKVDGELMCPEACCGKPVMECSCGPDCEHCNCHEIQKLSKADESVAKTLGQYQDTKDFKAQMQNILAKKKALQDIQLNPNTAKDPELKKELMKRKQELEDDMQNLKAKMQDRGMGEDVNEAVDKSALQDWFNKYKKYKGNNADELPAGMLKAYIDTGILTDGVEANEFAKAVKAIGGDKYEAEQDLFANPEKFAKMLPITHAMQEDYKKIMGVSEIDEDNCREAAKILGDDVVGFGLAENDEQDMDALKRNIQAQDKEVADAEARLRARAKKVDKNKLKAWYDKYSKYQSNNYDNLVWGMIKAWTDTGILTDAYEENEWAAVVDKFGEDKADSMEIDQVMKYMPITKAMHDEIEEMFGTIGQGGEDTLEMVYQMLKSMGVNFLGEDDMSTGTVAYGKKGKTRRATGINDNPYDHNEGEDHPALVNAALWNMKDIYQTIMAGEEVSEDDMFSYGDVLQYLDMSGIPGYDFYEDFIDTVSTAVSQAQPGGFAGQGDAVLVDKKFASKIKTLYQQFKAVTAKIKGVKEEPMSQADMDRIAKDEWNSMRMDAQGEWEEYKDAVMSEIEDGKQGKGQFAGKSTKEIVAMLRQEADSIGYADVSDGDRRPEESGWLNAIADELEKSNENIQRIKTLAGL